MARRQTALRPTSPEPLEERRVLSSLFHKASPLADIIEGQATYFLNNTNPVTGPNEFLLPLTVLPTSHLTQQGFTEVQGILALNVNPPAGQAQASGTLQLFGPKGTMDVKVQGGYVNFSDGPLGLLTQTTRLDYSVTGGTGNYARVKGTGKLDMITQGFFFPGPASAGASSLGKIKIIMLPDGRNRNTPLPVKLGGTTSGTIAATPTTVNAVSAEAVDNLVGSGSLGSLGRVSTLSGSLTNTPLSASSTETTGTLTATTAKGTVTFVLQALDAPAAGATFPKDYAVVISDSTGGYAGATGKATAVLSVSGQQFTLKFSPVSK